MAFYSQYIACAQSLSVANCWRTSFTLLIFNTSLFSKIFSKEKAANRIRRLHISLICSPLFFLFDKLYPSFCGSSPPQDSRTTFKLGFTSRPPATFPRISDMNNFILFFHSNCITISYKIPSGFPRKYSYKHLLQQTFFELFPC